MLTEADVKLLMDIANTGYTDGFLKSLRTVYDRILSDTTENDSVPTHQSSQQTAVNDFGDLETKLLTILAAHPDNRDVQALMGLNLTLAGKKEKALQWLEAVKSGSDPAAQLANKLLAGKK